MFRNLKKCLSLFLTMLMVLTCVPVVALTAETEINPIIGICGPNATWTLEDGVLTISGTGEIKTYFDEAATFEGYKDNIVNVIIEKGITSICDCVFNGCSNLESIIIPDSVTSIGEDAFRYCKSLKSIMIPDSVTSIGGAAFYYCTNLSNIKMSNSINYIGSDAFSNTAYYNNPANRESGAFYIGNYLVYVNSLDETYTIKDGTRTIGDNAFSGSPRLKELTIPDSLINLNGSALSYQTETLTFNISSENPNFISENGILFNKDKTTLIKAPVTLKNYTIPDSVTSIGDYAFARCSSLKEITIPNSVISIGEGAFQYCSSLELITIPDGVTNIGENAFENCSSLTEITIPDSVTSINWGTFDGCSNLTEITIPDSVTSIDSYAFSYCSSLTEITIPDGVISINDDAFSYCFNLSKITLPDSLTNIGENILYYTEYINNENNWDDGVLYVDNHLLDVKSSLSGTYEIKDGTKTIAAYAFSENDNLTNIIIPNSVISIGDFAFSSCRGLVEITIPNSIIAIGVGSFSYSENLKKINIPDNVTYLPIGTFVGCYSLSEITLGKGLTTIEPITFGMCMALKNITIPANITKIDHFAFAFCELEDVYIENENTEISVISMEIEDMTYDTISKTATIHAPCKITETNKLEYATPYSYGNEFVSIDGVHNFTEWTTTKEATPTENGSRERYCTVCNEKETETIEYVAIKNISVDVFDVVLEKDNTTTITVTATPDNATNPDVTYTSENETVATVDNNGTITAVGNGETIITVEAVENPDIKAVVNVKVSVPVTSFEANIAVGELVEGNTTTITATVPSEVPADDVTVTYESEDANVATVDENGVITGVTPGTTNIIVTVTDSFGNAVVEKVALTIKAASVPVTDITTSLNGELKYVGDSVTIAVTVAPENATDKTLTFTSSDTSVIAIANGKLTAMGPGTATVTITSADGSVTKILTFEIAAKPNFTVKVPDSVSLGEPIDIIVETNNDMTYAVEYESSDNNVITVDENGNLVSVGDGTVTITAKVTFEDGTVVTKVVTVKSVDTNKGKFFCSFCDDYEAMKDSAVGFIYTIIHFLVHFVESIKIST